MVVIERPEEFNFELQVNLVGTFNVIRLATVAIMTNEHGERDVNVNTASDADKLVKLLTLLLKGSCIIK